VTYFRTRMGMVGDAPRRHVGGSPLSGGNALGGDAGAAGGACVVAGRRAGTGVPGWGLGLRHLHTVVLR